jgi:hypothetical protein
VYRDGAAVAADHVDDECVILDNGSRLTLDRGLVLRHGTLGSSVLNAVPGIDRIAPARIFLTEECKWRSRALLTRPGGETEEGWSIHEVVRWP